MLQEAVHRLAHTVAMGGGDLFNDRTYRLQGDEAGSCLSKCAIRLFAWRGLIEHDRFSTIESARELRLARGRGLNRWRAGTAD